MASNVYFCREVSPDSVVKVFNALNFDAKGKVAIKVQSGEKGNQNFLRPEFWENIVDLVKGTIVECNTAYPGARNSTEKHKQLLIEHGWVGKFNIDLMDEDGDTELSIPNGRVIHKDIVGGHLLNYDSMLVLSHFKGHPMGGYGGALKQLSIGCASTKGKSYIHTAGKLTDQTKVWDNVAKQDDFLTAMAEAASAVVNLFGGNIAFINVMANMSVDCDCCAVAEDPCMQDIGVLASLDPVAIDKACLDLVYASKDKGRDHLVERIESRNGKLIVDVAKSLGVGDTEYNLIEIK